MNIPDEVILAAQACVWQTSGSPAQTSDLAAPSDLAAFHVIAEWARKEAQREAARVAEQWGMKNEAGGYTRSAFMVAVAIRALADVESVMNEKEPEWVDLHESSPRRPSRGQAGRDNADGSLGPRSAPRIKRNRGVA